MNILAVGAHWDDIELGGGLTLKKLHEKGHKVFSTVICSSQYGSDENEGMTESEALESGLKSFKLMGATYVSTEKEPNSKLVYNKNIMQILENIVNDKNIDTVFTHWYGDLNTDHKATWDISRTAFRNVQNFFMYQSNSYEDNVNIFKPNFYSTFNKEEYSFKEKILSQYETEWNRRKSRWTREIFERERYWGHISGSEYAEGFQIGKLVDFSI
jgi:LmbE family N-acetylglucosaminyl deacetylase|tara:strand:- start:772 stop:1413 length:642 start_codon:yes stop_codon:yes gene_type:complete